MLAIKDLPAGYKYPLEMDITNLQVNADSARLEDVHEMYAKCYRAAAMYRQEHPMSNGGYGGGGGGGSSDSTDVTPVS